MYESTLDVVLISDLTYPKLKQVMKYLIKIL